MVHREINRILEDARAVFAPQNVSGEISRDDDAHIRVTLAEHHGIPRAPLEPGQGALLGVNLTRDRRVSGIVAFDYLTGRDHAILATSMTAGGETPINDILTARLLGRKLLLTIYPPEQDQPFDEAAIHALAIEIGRHDLPVFINFFPFSREYNFNSYGYLNAFRTAARAFRQYAENVVIVWSVNVWDVDVSGNFFPGYEYVDWAGISINAHIQRGGRLADFAPHLESFVLTHQERVPIMITALSISHFSSIDGTYRSYQAAEALRNFYHSLEAFWPRIKAVVYFGYNDLERAGANRNITSIAADPAVTAAYKLAVTADHFLSELPVSESEISVQYVSVVSK